mmetsp:Transcript_54351/g.94865  ORF Transcript_54351/g.94865 Transcript_54351/m.94865 type:complete len:229 (+) Transcript_54351:802-1488(+)
MWLPNISIFFCAAFNSSSARYLCSFSMRMRSFMWMTLSRRLCTSCVLDEAVSFNSCSNCLIRLEVTESAAETADTTEAPPSKADPCVRTSTFFGFCAFKILTHISTVKSLSFKFWNLSFPLHSFINSCFKACGQVAGFTDSAESSCSFKDSFFFFNVASSAAALPSLSPPLLTLLTLLCSYADAIRELSFSRREFSSVRSLIFRVAVSRERDKLSISLRKASSLPFTF